MDITSIIIKPRITEKTQNMKSSSVPKMAFVVNKKANKNQIRVAFKALFGVEPKSINVINRKKSPARFMNKSKNNYHKAMRIAYVTVEAEDFDSLQDKALEEQEEIKKISEKEPVKDGN